MNSNRAIKVFSLCSVLIADACSAQFFATDYRYTQNGASVRVGRFSPSLELLCYDPTSYPLGPIGYGGGSDLAAANEAYEAVMVRLYKCTLMTSSGQWKHIRACFKNGQFILTQAV